MFELLFRGGIFNGFESNVMNYISFFVVHIFMNEIGEDGSEAFNRYGHAAEMGDKALYRYKKSQHIGCWLVRTMWL